MFVFNIFIYVNSSFTASIFMWFDLIALNIFFFRIMWTASAILLFYNHYRLDCFLISCLVIILEVKLNFFRVCCFYLSIGNIGFDMDWCERKMKWFSQLWEIVWSMTCFHSQSLQIVLLSGPSPMSHQFSFSIIGLFWRE